MTPSWGVIGTGWMADNVAGELTANGGRIAAVVSRSPRRGAAFAVRHGIPVVCRDVGELLERDDVQAVYVGSPNSLHASQTRQCLRAGRHVLCDKPLALTAREAELVADEAAAMDVRLGTIFQGHHHPVARRIREAIGSGRIGRVELVRASLGFGPEDLVGWRARPSLAGSGAVFNLGVHVYDMVRFLLGSEVTAVTALVDPEERGRLDRTALSLLRFGSGTLAYVQVSQALTDDDVAIEIRGSDGSISWTGWMAPYRTGTLAIRSGDQVERRRSACPDAYGRLIRAFVDALQSGAATDPSPRDGVEAVRIAEAVRRSARTGGVVRLSR